MNNNNGSGRGEGEGGLASKLQMITGIQDEETCRGIKSKSSEGRVQCCHIAFVRNARLVVPVVVTCVGSGGLQRSYHGAA